MPSTVRVLKPVVSRTTTWRQSAALGIAERGGRTHDAGQASVGAAPDERLPSSMRRKADLDALEGGDLVGFVEPAVDQLGKLGTRRPFRWALGAGAGRLPDGARRPGSARAMNRRAATRQSPGRGHENIASPTQVPDA